MAVPDGKVSGPAPVMAGARDMPDETSESSRLAVLIDADNARPSVVEGRLAEEPVAVSGTTLVLPRHEGVVALRRRA